MNNKQIALGVGGTLVVLATTFGAAALASAQPPTPTPTPTATQVGWGGPFPVWWTLVRFAVPDRVKGS